MKKTVLVIAIVFSVLSCNKTNQDAKGASKEMKTAYVDTSKLMDEYEEAKDITAKYKGLSETAGKNLAAQANGLKAEEASFQKNAQANGQAWAQQKYAELQKKEQELQGKQQETAQKLQQESGAEMDTLVKSVKKFIKDYGKQKGYSYIYGTGETATVLYAEDKYDITKEMIKLLNDKYKSEGKKDTKADDAKK